MYFYLSVFGGQFCPFLVIHIFQFFHSIRCSFFIRALARKKYYYKGTIYYTPPRLLSSIFTTFPKKI